MNFKNTLLAMVACLLLAGTMQAQTTEIPLYTTTTINLEFDYNEAKTTLTIRATTTTKALTPGAVAGMETEHLGRLVNIWGSAINLIAMLQPSMEYLGFTNDTETLTPGPGDLWSGAIESSWELYFAKPPKGGGGLGPAVTDPSTLAGL